MDKDIIVIAEDSPPNRKILGHLLMKLGFQVVACENGQMAWEKLQTIEISRLAAVISDIMMPTMDGIELLRLVREDSKLSATPFVLVTAISEKDYIAKARNLNVNGYILKPVTFQRVTAKMQELFPDRTFPKLTG